MTPDPTLIERLCDLHKRLSLCFEGATGERPPSRPRPFEPQFADLETLLDAATALQGSAALPSEAITAEMRVAGRKAAMAYRLGGPNDDALDAIYTAMRATTPTAPTQDTGVPCGTGSRASHEASISVESSPEASIPNAGDGCTAQAIALVVGLLAGLWVMGLWMNPNTLRWTDSLPFGLGVPVFIGLGTALAFGAFLTPPILWALIASAIEAGTAKTGTGLVHESAAPQEDAQMVNPTAPVQDDDAEWSRAGVIVSCLRMNEDKLSHDAADVIERLSRLSPTPETGLVEALRPLVEAARGLSHGVDWNNGTHAKTHGYRRKLLKALPAAELALSNVLPDEV